MKDILLYTAAALGCVLSLGVISVAKAFEDFKRSLEK